MIRKAMERDLKYIENDIIAQQKNGLYCKFSRLANTITITNLTKEVHLKYWIGVYKVKYSPDKPETAEKYYMAEKILIDAINDKFNNKLNTLEEVIDLENKSHDCKKEKDRLFKAITEPAKPNQVYKQNSFPEN